MHGCETRRIVLDPSRVELRGASRSGAGGQGGAEEALAALQELVRPPMEGARGKKGGAQEAMVLILDEVDLLSSKGQAILYDIFSLPQVGSLLQIPPPPPPRGGPLLPDFFRVRLARKLMQQFRPRNKKVRRTLKIREICVPWRSP